MGIIILFAGLLIGLLLNGIISKILVELSENKYRRFDVFSSITCGICFITSYVKLGLGIIFIKAVVLSALLIIISFVDLKTRIIPDFMVIIITVIGIIFSFIGVTPFVDCILGILAGGGILFLMALVPNAMGGGDIKLMAAAGAFLGLNRTLWAILIAFIAASIVSLLLLLFKIVGRKDHIPFGPFLAVGSFISLIIFI